MKKNVLIFIILIFCCNWVIACGSVDKIKSQKVDKSQMSDVDSKSNVEKISLSIKDIFELANKKDNLTLADFTDFSNGKDVDGKITFDIDYRGIMYQLQVMYDKEEKLIREIKLIHLLSKDSIDIRFDSLEEFLDKHMSMSVYLTYQLPDKLVNEKFNHSLGNLGGNLFALKENGSTVAIDSKSGTTPYGWNSYGGVEIYYKLKYKIVNKKIREILIPWNHSSYLSDLEYIDECEHDALLVEVSHDLYTEDNNGVNKNITSKMWYVFFINKNSDISYSIFLNADLFSKDDIIKLAKSVTFKDLAFNITIQ